MFGDQNASRERDWAGPPGGGGRDEDGRLDGASVMLGGGDVNKSERENDGER